MTDSFGGTEFRDRLQKSIEENRDILERLADTERPDVTDVIRAERAFLIASRNVWYEIDRLSAQPGGYTGLVRESNLRLIEREAWERYRDACDAADLMICPRCDGQMYDRGSCSLCQNTGYAWVGDS